tara:strand:+ start:3354 stop:4280 length:927 start_codon:yes stop_codon:yes gene_type:complete
MSNTHDYNIADQVGASFRADLNNVLGDIQSTNSGTSVPSSNVVGKLFVNTSNNTLNICTNASTPTYLLLGKTDVANMGHATTASPSFTGTITSAGDIVMSGTGSLQLPTGTTAQRPTAATGDIRFNTTLSQFEGYNGAAWGEIANGVPAGSIFSFASTTVPSGYLECNGAAISRSTYATLFATISTTFGSGDGSSTFNLPDLRGQFVRGWANNASNTGDDGRSFASSQADQNKTHAHTASVTDPGHKHVTKGHGTQDDGGSNVTGSTSGGSSSTSMNDANTGISVSVASDGGAEVRVKNIALMYVIKF